MHFFVLPPPPMRATCAVDLILGRFSEHISYYKSIWNTWAEIFIGLVLSRTLCGKINITGNKLRSDFRLPTLCRWGLHSSETFRGVQYVTDVSGQYRLHLQVPSTPKTILLGPLDPWRWDRYVVPKRRARTTDPRRATSQKSQDLKRRQVVPKLRTGWFMITCLYVPTAVCRFLLILSENLNGW